MGMKKFVVALAAIIASISAYSQAQLHLGARIGGGAAINYQKLTQVQSAEGFKDAVTNDKGWELNAKAEALLGFGRFRFGYRFMYLRSYVEPGNNPYGPLTDFDRYSVYQNSTRTHLFGHYGVLEIAVINSKFFALTPAIAAGGFHGYTVDNSTKEHTQLSRVTKNRFSIGAELNAEFKIGPVTLMVGPNYYLFNQQDKVNTKWSRYTHVIGADAGIRVNLLGKAKSRSSADN